MNEKNKITWFLTRISKVAGNRLNASAMVAEKLLRTALNMLVFAILARSLGPEQFGVFGLVQAVFFVAYPISLYVNQQILVKYLVADKRDCLRLQRTALISKACAATVVYGVTTMLSVAYFDPDVAKVIAVYCFIHLVNTDIIFFSYLRANDKNLRVLTATASVVFPFALLKIILALATSELIYVSLIYVLEAASLSLIARTTFKRSYREGSVSVNDVQSGGIATTSYSDLFSTCWPIILSAVLATMYLRVDQFMIDAMLTKADLGYYTAAVKISEASTIVVTGYLLAYYPKLLRIRRKSRMQYNIALVSTMRYCVLFSFVAILLVYLFGDQILGLLYGSGYLPAKNTLVVHLAGTPFIYYGLVCTQWLIAEGLQIYRVYRVLAGLILNVLLNLYLIPVYGILGAAVATLITQAFSSFLFNGFSARTRPIFKLQLATVYKKTDWIK